MGHHDEPKDNKKTTPTSDIAPGSPLWYASATGVHHQKDFGPGYDSHDPVGLHKGTFIKGNSVDRFGEIGFRFDKQNGGHGQIMEILIDRKGGVKTDQTVVIGIDRDPLGDGVDYNTGTIGIYNSLEVDGFKTNNVDLDLKTLNTDPSRFSYDDDTHRLTVNCLDGEDQIKIRAIVPYRTDVSKLLPVTLNMPVTYRVDEYMHLGIKRNNLPSSFVDSSWTDLITDEPDNAIIYNHQANYSIMTLPVPAYYVAQGDPTLLDGYNTELQRWHTVSRPFTADKLDYTVGKTRSIEGTCYARYTTITSPAQSANSTYQSLTGNYADGSLDTGDFAVHHIYDGKAGEFNSYISTDTVAIESTDPTTSVTLTAHTYGKSSAGIVGSHWTSKTISIGTDPDTDLNIKHTPRPADNLKWNEFPELDPGGDSEFAHFQLPKHQIFKYGDDVTEVGHMAQAMFKGRGVDPAALPTLKYCVNPDIKASDYVASFPDNEGVVMSEAIEGRMHPLSGDGFAKFVDAGKLLEAGSTILTKWVTQNTTTSACSADIGTSDYDKELVLYDLRQLSNPVADYQINEQKLAGYYTTCVNHIDRQVFLKMESDVAEPVHGWSIQQMLITIEHGSAYDTTKHAEYDSSINPDNMIKTLDNAGVTYKPGDSWMAGPTGKSLLETAFGAPTSVTTTTSFTGISAVGPLSANDVTFLGLAPGIGSAAALQAANDAAAFTPGYLALSAFQHNNKTDLDDGVVVPYYTNDDVVGNQFELDPLVGAPKYLYMSNPGDSPITVIMDIPTLNGVVQPLGATNGSNGSPYFHGQGDVIDDQTVEALGGGGGGPWRFTLEPNEGTDVIWQINNITTDTEQIIQTTTPGAGIQTATLTYK